MGTAQSQQLEDAAAREVQEDYFEATGSIPSPRKLGRHPSPTPGFASPRKHRISPSPTLSGSCSDSWSSVDSDMTKAECAPPSLADARPSRLATPSAVEKSPASQNERVHALHCDGTELTGDPALRLRRYNRRVIDEEKYAMAHEERAIKVADARKREKHRRDVIDEARARVEKARLQRHAAIERVDQCREYNADVAETVRYESSRIESHIAADELAYLRRNEARASAARQERLRALAASRENLFYDRVARVQQVRAPPA